METKKMPETFKSENKEEAYARLDRVAAILKEESDFLVTTLNERINSEPDETTKMIKRTLQNFAMAAIIHQGFADLESIDALRNQQHVIFAGLTDGSRGIMRALTQGAVFVPNSEDPKTPQA